jgi:EmrB/QacA subfamily drug resistance transporter
MRRYLIYAVVGLALLIISLSGTAISVAFPQIMTSFDTSLIVASWVLSIGQLANTIAMPLTGKACDIFGRKFIFVLCTILFTLGSVLCAIAPNIELLIFFRLIQGIGGGGFLPAATAIVAEEFPKTRQQSIGFFSSIFPIGQILGPNLGGWLVTAFGWRSTFWMSVPLGVIVLIVSLLLLRKTTPESDSKLDLTGAGMLCGFVSSIMVGISLMGNNQGSILWWGVGSCFAFAIILLLFFLKRQPNIKDPIIDVQVLREKQFVATNVYNFFYGIAVLGVFSFIPLYAVSVFNMSTLDSGLILTPRSIAMVVASILISINLVRWGYRWPIFIGTVLTAAALFILARAAPGTSLFGWQANDILLLSAILLIAGFSQGMVAPAANNACIELMPERIGTITGVRGMFRQVGSAFSVGITAMVVNNVGDMAKGFYFVFLGMAVIMLLILPVVMFIPKGPNTPRKATLIQAT